MKAGSINLQKLFEQTIRYRIPLYQRPYVWEERVNWLPIWEDIRGLGERLLRTGSTSPHFLGAIVLDQVLNQTGEIESRQVIDGQQRLTTLQLMLAAFRDLAVSHNLEKIAKKFEKLTFNDESFRASEEDAFKVWPTNRDRKHFSRVLNCGSLEKVCDAFKLSMDAKNIPVRIPGAYIFFHRAAADWVTKDLTDSHGRTIDASLEQKFDALWTIVRSHLMLVAIDLEDEDDAQVIFETLNARGTQLLPADLVKNYLFQLAESPDADLDELHSKYWKGFESDFWREEIRQGRLKRPRIDLFLQHYLTLKTLDEVPVSHVFSYFKRFVEGCIRAGIGSEHPGGPAAYQLQQLQMYGKIFKQFVTASANTRIGLFFERLVAIDTATVYPLLLEAFHDLYDTGKRSELRQLIRNIESYLVRRMICGLTTKNYNRFFIELIRTGRLNGCVSAQAITDYLLKGDGDSVRWPGNKELRQAMLDRHLYRKLSQKKLRMILLALDHQLEDDKTEAAVYTKSDSFTIEHIMPQAWKKNWPLPLGDFPEWDKDQVADYRDDFIHTIGNLTLLTDKLNPALSSRGWEYKQSEILARSKLNLNRSYFTDIEQWNEDWIYERSRVLCRLAARIWPYPRQDSSAVIERGEA